MTAAGASRHVCDPVRSRCARGGSLRHRNRQSLGRRRIGADALDPPDRRSRGGCASRSHDRAHGDAPSGDRAYPRKPGFRPLGRGVFLAFVNGYWLSAAAPLASALPLTVGFAAARSIVERRAGTKIAAERSTLARFHSPLLLDHLLREPDFLEKPVRQDVAVMFLDLSGSTGVAEALGPERSRDLFSAMQTLVEGEVTAHGGVVITYMGDGVLAVFGLPKPRSDDAARALATVEALRESMTAWLADLPPAARERLDFRIGLHFGPGHPVSARFADPTADHRDRRHGQCREPATGGGQAAALPRRRLRGSFPGGKRRRRRQSDAGYAPLTVPIRGRASDLRVRMRN